MQQLGKLQQFMHDRVVAIIEVGVYKESTLSAKSHWKNRAILELKSLWNDFLWKFWSV